MVFAFVAVCNSLALLLQKVCYKDHDLRATSSVVRALPSHGRGPRFKSLVAHHYPAMILPLFLRRPERGFGWMCSRSCYFSCCEQESGYSAWRDSAIDYRPLTR